MISYDHSLSSISLYFSLGSVVCLMPRTGIFVIARSAHGINVKHIYYDY